MSTKAQQKQERLAHANALIRVIAAYGRRFFWHGGALVWDPKTQIKTFVPADRYAQLALRDGKVYFIDDYSQKAVYTHKTTFNNGWRGFSHGGTLRSLVEDLRDYVMYGTLIPRWKIVTPCLDEAKNGNIWGYDEASAVKVREAAYALPLLASA